MGERNGNGSLKIWQAILIALVTMLLGIVATLGTTGMSMQSRVAAIETRVEGTDQRYELLTRRLDRIEAKLDRLIER